MIFQNIECLRLKIRIAEILKKREKGQMQCVMGMFSLLFLAVVLYTQLQIESYKASSLYLEDALATSNLASAVIDLEEFGISHTIQVKEPLRAYELYCEAVKENLQLNHNWEGTNESLLSGRVTIEDYVVYNVKENLVTAYRVTGDGQTQEWQGTLGSVKAPNDIVIEATSIYSEIMFPVEGFMGTVVQARKGKLVDVVLNES